MNQAQPLQSAKTAEWFNEAAVAAADYSSKAAARQLAFARKVAEQNGDWRKLLTAPDAADIKRAASDYIAFVRETVEDFVQASDRHFALLERAIDGAADGRTILPQAEAFGRQWVSGAKAANAAVHNGVRASCRAAADGLNADGKAATAKPAKTGKK